MSTYIEKLTEEHNTIIRILEKVKSLGIRNKEGRVFLTKLKKCFTDHLKNEDENFYPVLYQYANSNSSKKEILNMFIKEMLEISDEVFAFFNNYEKETKYPNIEEDFEKIYVALMIRVRREEKILFKEYEKHALENSEVTKPLDFGDAIVDELLLEHAEILKVIKEITHNGIIIEDSKELFLKFKEVLLKHKNNENEKLIAVLNEASKGVFDLKTNFQEFIEEHDEFEEKIEEFFENLESETSEMDVLVEFGKIVADLTLHMNKEEKILYSEFKKLQRQKNYHFE